MLHSHGNCYIFGHLVSRRDDSPDAGKCPGDGISKALPRSWCWICNRMDVLVSVAVIFLSTLDRLYLS